MTHTAAPGAPDPEEVVIDADTYLRGYWRDLWRARELLFFFAWRDVLVRYKQTLIGMAWSVLRPLLTTVVLTVVFGRLAGLPSEGLPYPLLVLGGVLAWQVFSTIVTDGSASLVANAHLVGRVYFPRVLLPLSTTAVAAVDLVIPLLGVAAVCWAYEVPPTWRLLTLPLMLLLVGVASTGIAIWLAALNAMFRDIRHLIPFLMQLVLYLSPVGFTVAIVPEAWRPLYAVNPLVGAIEGVRWALLGGLAPLPSDHLLSSVAVGVLLFVSGSLFFVRVERRLADVI